MARRSSKAAKAAKRERMVGNFRWVICGLLFLATTVNYIDRQVIGILKPTLQAAVWLERDRLRRHRLQLPAGLRDRLVAGGAADRSPRHAHRLSRCSCWCGASPPWRTPKRIATVRLWPWCSAPSAWCMRRRWPGSSRRGLRSASARPATFPRRSRRWPSGSRSKSARLPRASSTRAPTSARSWRRSIVPWITITYGWYWTFIATGAIGFLWYRVVAAAVLAA